jgi:hypothetical protein
MKPTITEENAACSHGYVSKGTSSSSYPGLLRLRATSAEALGTTLTPLGLHQISNLFQFVPCATKFAA